jgi:hypothetical protein
MCKFHPQYNNIIIISYTFEGHIIDAIAVFDQVLVDDMFLFVGRDEHQRALLVGRLDHVDRFLPVASFQT